ncbi:TPA: hypothetical protein JI046_15815 [Acinetobacter baumannii]|nr:hypothetical protein [Acinetobacter baumannii]
MLFLRYSGRSVNEDHVRYLKAHRKVGFFYGFYKLKSLFRSKGKTKRIRYAAIDFLLKLYKIYVFQYFVMSIRIL